MPNVITIIKNTSTNTTYKIYSYVKLTRRQILFIIADFLRNNKGKHPKNKIIKLQTLAGYDNEHLPL